MAALMLMWPQNTSFELRELHSELQVILARPKTEPALGQGVIIPPFRTAGYATGEPVTGTVQSVWNSEKYMQCTST